MLRIAVAQTPGSRLEQWPKTHELIEELIRRAAGRNADVVLFPECVWPAYFLGSTDDYFRAREAGMPSDTWFLAQLATWARTHRIAICAGYVAERGQRLHNAACLVGGSGEVLGRYHKCFLWDFDHLFFEAGGSLTPTDSEWGLVGLMICADARLPEIPATLVAGGARLFLQPTAWVNMGTPEALWNPQPELLIPERASEFGIPIASASKWGAEGGTTFVGSSLVCDGAGNVLAQCGTSETNLIVADVTLATPRKPQLTPEQRARLLAPQPAELPTADAAPLRVVSLRAGTEPQVVLNALQRAEPPEAGMPTLVLAPPPESSSPAGGVKGGNNWLLLTGPSDDSHVLGGARVAAVPDRAAVGFAPIRVLALDGVHLVVVFGENVATRTLRSRAAENRVFLVHVTSAGIIGYDPRGQEAGTATPCAGTPPAAADELPLLKLDVAQAADKEFAPRTNPFTQRRPELYAF